MTTAQLESAALAVPCPEHHVTEGTPCRHQPCSVFGDACMSRRELADARRLIEVFPPKEELARLEHDDLVRRTLCLHDAAQDLSRCVSVALGLDAPRSAPAKLAAFVASLGAN